MGASRYPAVMSAEQVERVRLDFVRLLRAVRPPMDDRQSGPWRPPLDESAKWMEVLRVCREAPMGLRDAAFEVLASIDREDVR